MSKPSTAHRFLAAMLLFAAASAASAAVGDDTQKLEQQFLAQPGNSEAAFRLASSYRATKQAERGVTFFSRFHTNHQPTPMSLVWQGSLKTMMSSGGNDMEVRLNLLQTGVADMDRAVRLFPNNLQVKLVRGVTISNFPSFLEMRGKAIGDLTAALKAPAAIGPQSEALARQVLARLYRQDGQEEEARAVEKKRGKN